MPTLPLVMIWFPLKVLLLLRRATFAESSESGTVPLVNCEAFRLVRPFPLPPKVPESETPVSPLVTTFAGSCEGEKVPTIWLAA